MRLTEFEFEGKVKSVNFVETQQVKEGVNCDVYTFLDDAERDLAIVTVVPGFKTPLQRVLLGAKTVEGYVHGEGKLAVRDGDEVKDYVAKEGKRLEVEVKVGQIMQWHADGQVPLVFYEVCEPPYFDGRFENLAS